MKKPGQEFAKFVLGQIKKDAGRVMSEKELGAAFVEFLHPKQIVYRADDGTVIPLFPQP